MNIKVFINKNCEQFLKIKKVINNLIYDFFVNMTNLHGTILKEGYKHKNIISCFLKLTLSYLFFFN